MQLLENYIKESSQLELFLVSSISLFWVLTMVFLTSLFLSRYITKRRKMLEKRFEPIIEDLLFAIMFEEITIIRLLSHRAYLQYKANNVFIKMLIRSCFDMHQIYSGDTTDRLEKFYETSILKEYSIQKLNSKEWYKNCQGIRELSEMNQEDQAFDIALLCFSKHQLVKQTAFMGIIKLKGLEGLKSLKEFNEYIDDWTLAHILATIEEKGSDTITDISFLLQHKNPSMILLGLQLIRYFRLPEYNSEIHQIGERVTNSKRVSQELLKHLQLVNNREQT